MRKAGPAKACRQSRPELGLTLILSSPRTTHTNHTGKIICLPSYLCLLATLLLMPSPCLSPFLSAVTTFCLLFWGALRSSCSLQWEHGGGGLGGGALPGCVDSVRTSSHFYLVYRPFEQCSSSPSLANVRTDGFNSFPSLPLWGVFPPSTFLSLFVCKHPVEDLVCLRSFGQATHLFLSFST